MDLYIGQNYHNIIKYRINAIQPNKEGLRQFEKENNLIRLVQ